MKNLPPLTPLPSFRAAARHGSLTKAAQELNVTHGAISRAIRQLEAFFGFDLFERRNRGVFLTEKGKILADHVGTMFSELEQTCERLAIRQDDSRLSVSCEPTLAMRWLMPRLDDFHRTAPGVNVLLSTAGGPIDLLEQGVDLAIRRSDFATPGQYWHFPLGRELIGPVCSPRYWEGNASQPKQILHTRTRPGAWADWRKLSGTSLNVSSEQFFDHFYFSIQAATAGLGLAIGPLPLVRDALAQEALTAPFGFVKTPVQYIVICRNDPGKTGSIPAFISWLKINLGLPVDEGPSSPSLSGL